MSGTVTGTTSTSSAASSSAKSSTTGFNADFDTFLTLLTAQLKNQDPTNAMDPNEMTQQLVQFSGVEQQIKTNSNLESLIAVQQGSQLVSAAPLMGRLVEVESDQLALQGGQATLRLPAAGEARRVGIGVLNAQGSLVRTDEVDLGSSTRDWVWDGKDSNGVQQPDGAYSYVLVGAASDGTSVSVNGTVLARATSVQRSDGAVQLSLGGITVAFDKLRCVVDGS